MRGAPASGQVLGRVGNFGSRSLDLEHPTDSAGVPGFAVSHRGDGASPQLMRNDVAVEQAAEARAERAERALAELSVAAAAVLRELEPGFEPSTADVGQHDIAAARTCAVLRSEHEPGIGITQALGQTTPPLDAACLALRLHARRRQRRPPCTRDLRSPTSLAPRKTASDGHVPPLPPIFAID